MDDLIQNLAETLVFIREHGPVITPEEIERRKFYPRDERGYAIWEDGFTPQMETQTLRPLYRSEKLRQAAGKVSGGGLPDSLTVGNFPDFLQARRALLSQPILTADLNWAKQELQRPRSMLAFALDATFLDGSLAEVSFGYINGYDLPPWDTWVALQYTTGNRWNENILISWVPEWGGDLIDETIWKSTEGCFTWLKFEGEQLIPRGWQECWQD
ncbi:hypothetical protein [Deinococcus roseus]|nr:hypothetical protein [Deinococcus roseus]